MRRCEEAVNGAGNGLFTIACHNSGMGHDESAQSKTCLPSRALGGMEAARNVARLLDSLHDLPDAAVAGAAACALTAAELADAGISLIFRSTSGLQPDEMVLVDYPAGIGLADIACAEIVSVPVDLPDDTKSKVILQAWRSLGDRQFNRDERGLLEHVAPHFAPLALRLIPDRREGRTSILDQETGLWALPSFLEQADRRFDRLDVEDGVGTMFAIGWVRCDGATAPEASPIIVHESVNYLREMLRPIDLIGRIGPTRLGVWCDGVDHLIAAERADRIVTGLDAMLTGTERHAAIGIASRWPLSGDDPPTILARARHGLEQARLAATAGSRPVVRIWQAGEV